MAAAPVPRRAPLAARPSARRVLGALAAAAIAVMALWQARQAGVQGLAAFPDVARGLAATIVLWGASGYALTRVLLPAAMRPHWPLFVLPVGAMSSGLALTILGFAAMPFGVALGVSLTAGAVAAVMVHRRGVEPGGDAAAGERQSADGRPLPRTGERILRLGWPAYLAAIVIALSLVPVFRSGFATVIGEGSDAHLAAGTAHFLQHAYPTSVESELPVDRVPLVWRSKYPIYYSFAGASSLAGLDTVQTLATMAALLAALAVVGFFLLAHYLLRAGPIGSLVAAGLVGLNPMVFFTIAHPYFNQAWGLAAMPFIIVFSWWALRDPRAGTVGLALLFAAVGAFAYPLMMAFPAAAFVGFVFFEARRRRREGRPVEWLAPLRRLPRRRALYPLYALVAIALAVPLLGVFEKVVSGFIVVAQGRSLAGWAGDIRHYIPLRDFLSFGGPGSLTMPVAVAVAAAAWFGLRDAQRSVRRALVATCLVAGWYAGYFYNANDGQYFYFKTLAYLGPLVVALAGAGLVRAACLARGLPIKVVVSAVIALYLGSAAVGTRDQIAVTFDQVTPQHRDLEAWSSAIPADASIRLDLEPTKQLWAAYFLHDHPLSSQQPLTGTSYPHVPHGRKADYVVSETPHPRPADAAGAPLRQNRDFSLYRMRDSVPGPDRSSQRMVQTITSVPLG